MSSIKSHARTICWCNLFGNLSLYACNIIFYSKQSDLLSRFQVQTFQRETLASMNSCATDIPQALLPQNWEISFPSWRDPACSALRFLLINTLGNLIFDQFYLHISDTISCTLPISPHTLALFIAYMFDRRYAPATVNTCVSVLECSHKPFNLTDPTKVFFIMQMRKGYGKLGSRLDSRLPITLPILTRLLTVWLLHSVSLLHMINANLKPCVLWHSSPFYVLVNYIYFLPQPMLKISQPQSYSL
jgi:hypothetical protein